MPDSPTSFPIDPTALRNAPAEKVEPLLERVLEASEKGASELTALLRDRSLGLLTRGSQQEIVDEAAMLNRLLASEAGARLRQRRPEIYGNWSALGELLLAASRSTENALEEHSKSGAIEPKEADALSRRGVVEKAKDFENRVAGLYSIFGYRTTVDYKRDDMQFDIRLERSIDVMLIHALVECKDWGRPVTQQQVREFASKVEYATRVDRLPYQAILVARSGLTNNAHEVAKNLRVQLTTYEQLLRSLIDLHPNFDSIIRAYQGTALERLYVEQDVVFESDIKQEQKVLRRSLTKSVLQWLNESSDTLLTLLGDFGCGKTSLAKRLACELATYCESWFSHNDLRLTLTRDRKVALVEYLARLLWDSPENRVHYSLLSDKASEFFQDKPLTIHDKERVDYEVRTALFLRRDAEGSYSFIHRSFLEFFIARTIRAGLAAGDPRCLFLRRITREVAFFLEFWPEAKRIPDLARDVLEYPYQTLVSENALLLLYLHARASFGPLVGPGTESEPDFLKVREVFSQMRPRTLRLEGADLEGTALPGIDLSKAGLDKANLYRADLRQTSLDGSRLTGANLGFANLRRGSAEKAVLGKADLNHLDAREAVLRNAVLRRADLSFARLARADLQGADLDEAKLVGTAFLENRGVSVTPQPRELRWQAGHSGDVNSVAWSPDGRTIASGLDDRTIKIWDAAAGTILNTLQAHDNWVNSVSWSPDGTRLASGSRTVKVWDAASGRVLNTLQAHDNWVRSVSWSPDGTRLASGSDDRTVKVWDAASGRVLNTLLAHDNWVRSVSWSPDGARLASGSLDGDVKIWDAATGRLLNTFAGHAKGSVSTLRPGVLLYTNPDGTQFHATSDGYVFGPPEALEWVRFGDGFALYDVTDVPERVSEERIRAALA